MLISQEDERMPCRLSSSTHFCNIMHDASDAITVPGLPQAWYAQEGLFHTVKLECGHTFNVSVLMWHFISNNMRCPVCRHGFDTVLDIQRSIPPDVQYLYSAKASTVQGSSSEGSESSEDSDESSEGSDDELQADSDDSDVSIVVVMRRRANSADAEHIRSSDANRASTNDTGYVLMSTQPFSSNMLAFAWQAVSSATQHVVMLTREQHALVYTDSAAQYLHMRFCIADRGAVCAQGTLRRQHSSRASMPPLVTPTALACDELCQDHHVDYVTQHKMLRDVMQEISGHLTTSQQHVPLMKLGLKLATPCGTLPHTDGLAAQSSGYFESEPFVMERTVHAFTVLNGTRMPMARLTMQPSDGLLYGNVTVAVLASFLLLLITMRA